MVSSRAHWEADVAYKRILLGTDGSATSDAAGIVAAAIAAANAAELIVAHVQTQTDTRAQEILDEAVAAAEAGGVRAKRITAELLSRRPRSATRDSSW
jgi:nucleotide-binding universal stress UspA family protein